MRQTQQIVIAGARLCLSIFAGPRSHQSTARSYLMLPGSLGIGLPSGSRSCPLAPCPFDRRQEVRVSGELLSASDEMLGPGRLDDALADFNLEALSNAPWRDTSLPLGTGLQRQQRPRSDGQAALQFVVETSQRLTRRLPPGWPARRVPRKPSAV